MKKRIFIGSSVESKDLAYKLYAALEGEFECVLWYEDFFTIGDHYYTDLTRKIITFDYAVLIGAKDDEVTRIATRAQKVSPRDNIYLEYGLFSGILSPNRVLFLICEGCQEATDLAGMSLAVYRNDDHAVSICEAWVAEKKGAAKPKALGAGSVELLPTVGIAVGYYYNFIKPFLNNLLQDRTGDLPARKKLVILVPTFISDDIALYKQDLMLRMNLYEADICRYRILVDAGVENELRMYDIPSTILALFKTVNYIFGVTDGNTADTICAKQRALDNFYDNLSILISGDLVAKRMVSLERYSEEE